MILKKRRRLQFNNVNIIRLYEGHQKSFELQHSDVNILIKNAFTVLSEKYGLKTGSERNKNRKTS